MTVGWVVINQRRKFILIYFDFINKVRARIYIFSTVFRRGTGKGRVHFCVCSSHVFRRKICSWKCPIRVLRLKPGVGPAVHLPLSGREGRCEESRRPCWGWPSRVGGLPSQCGSRRVCAGNHLALHFLLPVMRKEGCGMPFLPVLTPKSRHTQVTWPVSQFSGSVSESLGDKSCLFFGPSDSKQPGLFKPTNF